MANFFSETQTFHSPNRSLFVMDHERLTTCQFGAENIALYEMTLPGDTWKHKSEIFARFMPMLSPVMTRIDCRTESFYVPFRLLWRDFPKFLRQQSQIDVNHGKTYILPMYQMNIGDRVLGKNHELIEITQWLDVFGPGSILEQIGYQTEMKQDLTLVTVPLLPLLAYTFVWHEFYRDENLQDEFWDCLYEQMNEIGPYCTPNSQITLNDGTIKTLGELLFMWPFQRAFEKDYFTSALPWTQKGAPVRIPLNINSDNLIGNIFFKQAANNNTRVYTPGPQGTGVIEGNLYNESGGLEIRPLIPGYTPAAGDKVIDNSASLGVNLGISGVTGPTVNEFRAALQLQKWKERNALSGTRYTELLLAHWGVKSSDASLQRPLFLGGSRLPVQISSVDETAQQVGSPDATVGDMYGHGITAGNSEDFEFTFEEHGIVMQFISFMPRTSYMQGTRRWLIQRDELEFGWPLLANLGEQPVYLGELYNEMDAGIEDTFGYQERYCQYKFIPSSVHGSFIDTLRYWHLGRYFEMRPELSSDFILTKPEAMNRIFNYTGTDYDPILVEIYNKTRAIRELPYHAKPM